MMEAEIKERIVKLRAGKVPEGYKYTKATLFPIQWPLVPLNYLLSENRDRNEEGLFNRNDVLSVSGDSGIVNQIDFMGRSYAGESLLNYHVVYPGNIVYTKSPLKENPFGIIKLNKGNSGIVSTLYAVYNCTPPITSLYLDYYFSVDTYLNNYLRPLVKKGAKNDMKVNNEDVLRGLIPLPPTPEQEKITEILLHCDQVIELKKQLVVEKRHQKKWLMQNLFDPLSGIRLPGFKGSWIRTKIGHITKVLTGATPSTTIPEYWGGDIPWMSSGELNNKHIHNVIGRITESGLNKSGTKMIPISSVLLGLAGQGKTRGTVAINHIELCTNQSIAAILPSEKHVPEYLYHNLDNRYDELRKISSGDRQRGGLNLELIKNIRIQMPTIEEQTAIAEVLSTADREINMLEQELAQWQVKKKCLMQMLFTGLVRVN